MATFVKFSTILPFPPQATGPLKEPILKVGVAGWAVITALPEATEVQPPELVTVKVYVVDAVNPEKVPVVVGPLPLMVAPPGDAVTVQDPLAGKPLKPTLPVAVEQVGCVIAPTTGAVGVAGCVLITASPEPVEVQPTEFVTVKV